MHTDADVLLEKFPALQSVHERALEFEYFPAPQGLHPPLLYWPAGQGMRTQFEEHGDEVCPFGQVRQGPGEFITFRYEPEAQQEQLEAPELEYVPGAHAY